jgi:hypothetical protein
MDQVEILQFVRIQKFESISGMVGGEIKENNGGDELKYISYYVRTL